MILFNDVVLRLALSQFGFLYDRLFFLEHFHHHWVSRMLVHVKHSCSLSMLGPQQFTQEARCCLTLPLRTQQAAQRMAF